jgi:hypothetical protein
MMVRISIKSDNKSDYLDALIRSRECRAIAFHHDGGEPDDLRFLAALT